MTVIAYICANKLIVYEKDTIYTNQVYHFQRIDGKWHLTGFFIAG